MCIYARLFKMSWTLSKIYYAVTKDMQYAPNCSATLNPPLNCGSWNFYTFPLPGGTVYWIINFWNSVLYESPYVQAQFTLLYCHVTRSAVCLSVRNQLWFRCSADPFPRFMLLCRLHLSVYLTVLPPRCVCVCLCVSHFVSETGVFFP